MQKYSISPIEMIASFLRNRRLIITLIKRDVIGRYRGSFLGILWSFFNPLLMLLVYTLVFSVIFKARWNVGSDSKTEFALVLFTGLIVFNLFAESFNRAPILIISNANYVKKVIFPLEILPWVTMGSSLFHAIVSLGVWFIFYLIFFGIPYLSALLLPVVILPIILFTMGISWFFASIGVFLRDLEQAVGIGTTVLMFLSPIFYPLSMLPSQYRGILYLNPLTTAVEQVRSVLIFGKLPNPLVFSLYLGIMILMAWLGFAWFQKTRKGFADVI